MEQKEIDILYAAGIVPAGTPWEQIQVFANVCKRHGLDPFSKEIYLLRYSGKYAPIISINGLRNLTCENCAGVDDAKFDLLPDGSYKTAAQFQDGQLPKSCTVTVWKMVSGLRVPFHHTVLYREFAANTPKWIEMPLQMITKVAESHARRKGWSISGLHIEEEVPAIADQTVSIAAPAQTPIKVVFNKEHNLWGSAVEKAAKADLAKAVEALCKSFDFQESDQALFVEQVEAAKQGVLIEKLEKIVKG